MWFSLLTTQLTTSSMVRGFSATACGASSGNARAEAAGASAAALPAAKNSKAKTNLRILLLPSVCQTELNTNASRVVHRLALAQGRLEFDLLRGLGCGLIESMAQATGDAVHLHVSAGQEHHIQHHVAFQFQATPFGRIVGAGFVQDGNSGVRRTIVGSLFLGSFRGGNRLVAKTSRLNGSAFSTAGRRIRRAISKSGTRHRAANSLIASGAVAVARSVREGVQSLRIHNEVR